MKRCLNCMKEYEEGYGSKCPHCGYDQSTAADDSVLPPGSILQGRYIVGTVIRRRKVDVIYQGWDALFDRHVRIQEYFPRYCAARSGEEHMSIYDSKSEQFQKGLELFYNSSRQLIRLYREEDVIRYYACFYANKTAYAVMEQKPFMTLQAWMGMKPLKEREALAVIRSAIHALKKVHQYGIVHGMPDGESFWIQEGGGLILKDFVSWRYVSGEPGVIGYGRVQEEADVYGLGLLFCSLLTGNTAGEELGAEAGTDALFWGQRFGVGRQTAFALKRVFSHETKTLEQLEEELFEKTDQLTEAQKVEKRRNYHIAEKVLRIPKRFLIIGGIAAALGCAAAAVIVSGGKNRDSGIFSQNEELVKVPNVVNKTADEAVEVLEKAGLGLLKDKKDYNQEVKEGIIYSQDCLVGMEVPKGTDIRVCISLGPEQGVIPDVRGKQLEEAVKLLNNSGFHSVEWEERAEQGIDGTVLEINETEGTQVDISRKIMLTVCRTESAKESAAGETTLVPDMVNDSEAVAVSRLEAAGLRVISVYEFYSQVEERKVFRQEPGGGTETEQGDYVKIYVSKGPKPVYMPDVRLMTEEKARERLEALGLTVGSVSQQYDNNVEKGKVTAQSAEPRKQLKSGDSVSLTISKGEKPASVQQTKPETSAALPETAPVETELEPENLEGEATLETEKNEVLVPTLEPEGETEERLSAEAGLEPEGAVSESGNPPENSPQPEGPGGTGNEVMPVGPGEGPVGNKEPGSPFPVLQTEKSEINQNGPDASSAKRQDKPSAQINKAPGN